MTITTEDFSGSEDEIFNTDNWTYYDMNNTSNRWVVAPGDGLDGSQCVKSASYKSGQNLNPCVFLISPKISFGSEVSFWAWGSSDGVENFTVMISTDGENYQQISDVYTASTTPTRYTFDLNGCRLSVKPSQKGIYIHNGSKEVVK